MKDTFPNYSVIFVFYLVKDIPAWQCYICSLVAFGSISLLKYSIFLRVYSNYYKTHVIRYLTILLFWLFAQMIGGWQEAKATSGFTRQESLISDTTRVALLNQKASERLLQGEPSAAFDIAQKALQIADSLTFTEGKVRSLFLMGKSNRQLKEYGTALSYYLQSLNALKQTKRYPTFFSKLYAEIGSLYFDWGVYTKAVENLEIAYQFIDPTRYDTLFRFEIIEQQALANERIGELNKALRLYIQLLNETDTHPLPEPRLQLLAKIAALYQELEDPTEAAYYTHQILEIHEQCGDSVSIAATYNNLGFLYKQFGHTFDALTFFEKSLTMNQRLRQYPNLAHKVSTDTLATIARNIGVLHITEGNAPQALPYLEQALSFATQGKNQRQQVALLNDIAQAYLFTEAYYPAKEYALQAVEISEAKQWLEAYSNACLILSEVYEAIKLHKKSLEFYRKHTEAQNLLRQRENQEREEAMQKRLEAEKTEQKLRQLIAERELKEQNIKQLMLQAQQRESQLELLKKQKELQEERTRIEALEKERAIQALELANEILRSEKKDREISNLQKDRMIQALELNEQRLRDEERQREIDLLGRNNQILSQEKQLQQLKLQDAERERNYIVAVSLLLLILIVFALWAFFQRQRAYRTMQKQKQEIESANDTLRVQHQHLQDGINYAHTIQQAILPKFNEIAQGIPNFFVIFKPRATVSGDFYWYHRMPPAGGKPERIFLAVVDCTGHGVPGGFMSMIGYSQLNMLIKEKDLENPQQILTQLHINIREALHQAENRNKDGMEIALCRLQPLGNGTRKLVFASAHLSVVHWQKNSGNIQFYKGDIARIGGDFATSHSFKNWEITVRKGDRIYLFTDGLVDQCNPERRRFGKANIQQMIQESSLFSLETQKAYIEETLQDFQQTAEQRDDITCFAFEI